MDLDFSYDPYRTRRARPRPHLDLEVDDALEYLELLCDPDPLLQLLRSGAWPDELEEPIAELTEIVRGLETSDQMAAAVVELRPRLRRWSRMAKGIGAPLADCG